MDLAILVRARRLGIPEVLECDLHHRTSVSNLESAVNAAAYLSLRHVPHIEPPYALFTRASRFNNWLRAYM